MKWALEKARDLIAKGWCRHTFSMANQEQPKYSVVGALEAAFTNQYDTLYPLDADTYWNLARFLPRCVLNPDKWTPILEDLRLQGDPAEFVNMLQRWNDSTDRTHEDVVNLFDRAIQQMEVEDEACLKKFRAYLKRATSPEAGATP